MRQVQVHISLDVEDDVTDQQLMDWQATVAAQVYEPVAGYDGSGNEQTFAASNVMLDLYVDSRALNTIG